LEAVEVFGDSRKLWRRSKAVEEVRGSGRGRRLRIDENFEGFARV
jgi:hypothetical protein